MSTLYELTEDYLNLLEMAEDPETDPQAFADTLEGLEGEIEIKADGYGKVYKQLLADAAMLKEEKQRLEKRQKAAETRAEYLKKHLEDAMKAMGKEKFKTELFSFNIQKNPPSVKIGEKYEQNPDLIPMDYLRIKAPEIDRKKILEELKNGKTFDFATLEQESSLRIK